MARHAERHQLTKGTAHMLKEARMAAKMTQAEAAWAIGCASSYVSELESGRKAPSTAMAGQIIPVYRLDKRQAARLLYESVDGVGRSRPSTRGAGASA